MQKAWPWHCLTILWLAGVVLFARALVGVGGYRIAILAACILTAELLFVGLQFVLQAHWEREWERIRNAQGGSSLQQSEGARFYYVIGMIGLFCALIYLDIATYGFLFSGASFSTLTFLVAVAHGCLKTARKLARVSGEVQHDAQKMADLELSRQATKKEMTRIAITIMGLGIAFTIMLCLYITYGSYKPSRGLPRWLGIPTLIAIAISIRRKMKGS